MIIRLLHQITPVHAGTPIITADHVILVAAIVGAAGALATATSVTYAALQLRRRPEVGILWWVDDRPWPVSEVVELHQGSSIQIRIGAHNVGNATGETSMTNFAVPVCCRVRDGKGQMGVESGNDIAGMHTGGKVFFIPAERRFYPGMMWIHDESIDVPTDPTMPIGFTHQFVFVVEDDRFSTTGKRWLPSRMRPLNEHAGSGKEWRRIQAMPRGGVVCGPGYRRSTRSVKIV